MDSNPFKDADRPIEAYLNGGADVRYLLIWSDVFPERINEPLDICGFEWQPTIFEYLVLRKSDPRDCVRWVWHNERDRDRTVDVLSSLRPGYSLYRRVRIIASIERNANYNWIVQAMRERYCKLK